MGDPETANLSLSAYPVGANKEPVSPQDLVPGTNFNYPIVVGDLPLSPDYQRDDKELLIEERLDWADLRADQTYRNIIDLLGQKYPERQRDLIEEMPHGRMTAHLMLEFLKHYSYLINGDSIYGILLGSRFHDVGKGLDPEGRGKFYYGARPSQPVLDGHVTRGVEALNLLHVERGIIFPDIAKIIVEMHHEKPDGTGYPRHRKDVPIPVVWVSAADNVAAMVANRPYSVSSGGIRRATQLGITSGGKDLLTQVREMLKMISLNTP